MKVSIESHILIVLCVLALAVGQILFKALGLRTASYLDIIRDQVSLLIFVAAIAVYATSTFLWIAVLRSVPLSYAYMFMAVGFILVPIFAHAMFDEPLSARFFIGACLIALGIWLVTE